MIKKYLDFINESIELVLESDVVYSDKLRLTLSKIENPIAKKLLDIENKDYPVKTNYFDILPNVNDKVSFIPDRKAQEILKTKKELVRYVGTVGWLKHKEVNLDIFSRLGYSYEEGTDPYSPKSMDIGEVISKITSEKTGNVYVWVKFKNESGEEVGEGVYNHIRLRPIDEMSKLVWSKNRQDVKVGKAMRAILDITGFEFTDSDLENFVNKFKSTVDRFNDKFSYFKLVDGEEIADFYNKKSYLKNEGSLGSSCMASVPRRYFSIYIENPNVCKLLILKSPEDVNKITGRALLWTLDSGEKFLDRIYTINDSDVELFRDYARENGWYSKYHNNSADSISAYNPNGSRVESLTGDITIKKGEYDGYPYSDTFKYLNLYKGTLSVESDTDTYKLESTGGNYISCGYCDGEGRVFCSDCDGEGESRCGECRGHGYIECYDCDGNGKEDCEKCDGEGVVEDTDGEEIECSDCSGKGKKDCSYCDSNGRNECPDCDGTGGEQCGRCYGSGSYDCDNCEG